VIRLDENQRRRVLELASAAQAQPGARDWSSVGCAGLVVTVTGLVAAPALGLGNPFVIGTLMALGLVALVLALIGAAVGLAPVRRRVDAAVATLVTGRGEPGEAALAAAVTLLVNAYHAPGPFASETFDAVEMSARLGEALPLVIAVEEVLTEAEAVYPVFTPVRPGGG